MLECVKHLSKAVWLRPKLNPPYILVFMMDNVGICASFDDFIDCDVLFSL